MIKKSSSRDRASAYISGDASSEIKMKFSMVAKRNGTLGSLSEVFKKVVAKGESYLVFDNIEFDEARAVVSIGGKRRMVGLIGHNSDAGVIEISDEVEMGDNGHPDHSSLVSIVDSILVDIGSYLSREIR